jgi:NitT/TauT family transport system substrate-binding protein
MKITNRPRQVILLITLCFTFLIMTACSKNGQELEETKNQVTETGETKAQGTETLSETEQEETKVTEKINVRIASLKGPTSMGLVKVMEDGENGVTANNYSFTIAGAADEITAGISKGEFDIAAIPSNLASILYNKTEGALTVAGINTLNVLYIIESGDSIQTVDDLKGKTIYSTGKGTTPEYTLNYLLTSYGLDPLKDVTIEYKTEATEVAALLSSTENAIAMLPQPFVTTVMMNNNKVRIALDVAKEWESVVNNNSTIVTGVVVVNKAFLENNKEAVDAFLEEYEASALFVNENVKEASALIEKFDIVKAAVAEKAIPGSSITFLQGEEMQAKLNGYLDALYKQNPNSIGGAMPGTDFYYMN